MRDIKRYESDYLELHGFEKTMVHYRRKQVLECATRFSHKRVLEIGCGLDSLANHLDGWDSFCIVEPSEVFVAHAKNSIPKGRDLVVFQGLFEDVAPKLSSSNFDFIVLSSLLHEVRDPTALLRAVASICAPESVVHINVPNAKSLHIQLAVKMGLIKNEFQKSELAERYQRTSTYDLTTATREVEGAGFKVLSSGTYFLKPATHSQLDRMFTQGIVDENYFEGLYEMGREMQGLGAELFLNVQLA